MKKIEIITRPFHLDEMKDVLSSMGVNEIIASDVRISGGNGSSDSYLQEDYFVEFMPKIKIEIFSDKVPLQDIVKAIKAIAEEDGAEDTKIYSFDVKQAL